MQGSGWTRIPTEASGLRLEIRAEFDTPGLRATLTDRMGRDSQEGLECVHEGRRAAVYRLRVGERSLFFKRYEFPRSFLLRTFAHSSRAKREARNLLHLEGVVESDVKIVAWGEVRRAGFCPRCYVVTTELEGCHDVKEVKRQRPEQRDAEIEVIKSDLPGMIARCHNAGVFLRDLRGKNLLLQPETLRISIIDVPRAAQVGVLSTKQRQYDLGTLYRELRKILSEEEWRGFMIAYLEQAEGVSPHQVEDMLRGTGAIAADLDHTTGLSGAVYHWRKRFKRTRLGELLSGHRYETKDF